MHLFQFINANLFEFRPFSFRTDFERGLRNAIINVFPLTKIRGCWFHYIRAIKRAATKKIPNFLILLKKNKKILQIYTKFLLLPLFKPSDIVKVFEMIKTESAASDGTNLILKPLITYFEKQWIEKVCQNIHGLYEFLFV